MYSSEITWIYDYVMSALFEDDFALHTERLIIRRFATADLMDTFGWCSNPAVSEFVSWDCHTTLSDTQNFLNDCIDHYRDDTVAPWAVVMRSTQRVVGACNFISYYQALSRAAIGYCLHPDFWHLGLGSEAVRAVVEFGFENGLKRIEASCETGNTASMRLLKRVGFEHEGLLRSYERKGDALIDVDMFSILPPA
jgi:ribosomal-protein-alanine N-acetyltransferase